jgi:hypothetical protein
LENEEGKGDAERFRLLEQKSSLKVLQARPPVSKTRYLIQDQIFMRFKRIQSLQLTFSERYVQPLTRHDFPLTVYEAVKTNNIVIEQAESKGVRAYIFAPCIVCA